MFRTRNTLHRNIAGLIAALAIATQVLVAGTHVHPLAPYGPAYGGARSIASLPGAHTGNPDDPTDIPAAPVSPEDCPLCVAFSQTGSALAATTPAIVAPAAFAVSHAAVADDRALIVRSPSPFAARAPPPPIA